MKLDGASTMKGLGCPPSSTAGAVFPDTVPAKPRKTHCPNGHAYSVENVIWQGNKRHCRTCKRLACARYNFKLKVGRVGPTSFKRGTNRRAPKVAIPLVRRLFEFADARRLSIVDLSEMTGYDRKSFYQWREGVCVPSFAAIVDCFNALGYDLVPVMRGKQ